MSNSSTYNVGECVYHKDTSSWWVIQAMEPVVTPQGHIRQLVTMVGFLSGEHKVSQDIILDQYYSRVEPV